MVIVEKREWHIDTDCPVCTSKLRVQRPDIIYWDNQSAGRHYIEGYHYQCPVCKNWVAIRPEDLPKAIQQDAVKRRQAADSNL